MTPRERLRRLWREWRGLVIFAALMLCFRSSFADWYTVPTGSMKPTVVEGDRVFVNKLAYELRLPFSRYSLAHWGDPRRGDIVVLYSPEDGMRLVKRVIGLPGDTLAMRGERLYVNGTAVAYLPATDGEGTDLPVDERSHALFFREQLGGRLHAVMFLPERPALRSFDPLRVPAGEYFVMGDNRDNSKDSRYIGFIPRDAIVGRATAVAFSLDPGHWYRPRGDRLFSPLE